MLVRRERSWSFQCIGDCSRSREEWEKKESKIFRLPSLKVNVNEISLQCLMTKVKSWKANEEAWIDFRLSWFTECFMKIPETRRRNESSWPKFDQESLCFLEARSLNFYLCFHLLSPSLSLIDSFLSLSSLSSNFFFLFSVVFFFVSRVKRNFSVKVKFLFWNNFSFTRCFCFTFDFYFHFISLRLWCVRSPTTNERCDGVEKERKEMLWMMLQ